MPLALRNVLLRHETILARPARRRALRAGRSSRTSSSPPTNLLNQGRLMTEVGLVALAMTFVIVTGGIDLSVGSILGLSAILLGVLLAERRPAAARSPWCSAIVVGGVRRLRQRPDHHALQRAAADRDARPRWRSIAASPRASARRARCAAIRTGSSCSARARSLGVPTQLWILGSVAIVAAVILGYTTFGRATYAIGANETAARFSGIAVDRTKLLIYTASGLIAGLAAVIFVSRVSTTRSDMGTGLELDVITAVVLGGTIIFGGRGTIVGTVLGLILIQALKNGLALAGVKGDGTIVVIGVGADR